MRRHCRAVLVITLLAMASLLSAQDDSAVRVESDEARRAVYNTYIIQSGDTLLLIARRFNTTVEVLKAINALSDSDRIIAGSALLAPAGDPTLVQVYQTQAGDTLFSLARRFKTSVGILKHLNQLSDADRLVAGETILLPASEESDGDVFVIEADETGQTFLAPRADDDRYTIHVVQPGDTLYDLSRLYHTTVAQLSRLNGGSHRTDLSPGQRLIMPKVDETLLKRYIAQAGDTLYGIAQRYDMDLTTLLALNRLAENHELRAGQALLAPRQKGRKLAIHRIKPGDTLEGIAERYETTAALLQSLNGIADPSLIVLDEAIIVPLPKELLARPGFGFGIQLFIDGERAEELAAVAKALGANWVKLDVSWAAIETAPQIYSYSALDAMVAALELAGLKIMLNVYDAPAWSRMTYTETLNSQFKDYGGPPEDYADFARFLASLVIRYAGLVDAYEIWKSPNLLKFWTVPVYARPQERTAAGDYGIPDAIQMGARYYVPLLEVAYKTIKAHDERALVIAAGLAPAGFNDNYNAIDTVTFLNNMLRAGAADFSDAIGAIFSASAAPPTFACCDQPPGVETHYESFLQYYGELLAFYDETLRRHGVDLPVFVTQLGWGTAEGENLALPSTGFEWLNYTSEAEQALYVRQAYKIAQKLEYVAAIFLYNYNGCAANDEEACFFSLEDAAGRLRPAFAAYQSIPKTNDAA